MKCWVRNARRVRPFGFAQGRLQRAGAHLLLLALLLSGAASQDTTFHTQTNVVVIPALVKGAKGEVVYGLTAKDFLVEDDGVEQAVRLDEAAEGAAVSMVVAIQRGRRANYEFPRIRGLKERPRVLLLISETRDHGSQAKVEDVVAEIGQSSAAVYALAFSPTRSNMLDTMQGDNLEEMRPVLNLLALGYLAAQAMRKNTPLTVASMTGGEYELFTTRKHFEARMIDFTNHVHNRYVLSIEPRNPHAGLHQLKVRLRDAGDRVVLARSRYWAAGVDQ
jgi:hypothetical protein